VSLGSEEGKGEGGAESESDRIGGGGHARRARRSEAVAGRPVREAAQVKFGMPLTNDDRRGAAPRTTVVRQQPQ